jgi:hypothetical protein
VTPEDRGETARTPTGAMTERDIVTGLLLDLHQVVRMTEPPTAEAARNAQAHAKAAFDLWSRQAVHLGIEPPAGSDFTLGQGALDQGRSG